MKSFYEGRTEMFENLVRKDQPRFFWMSPDLLVEDFDEVALYLIEILLAAKPAKES